MSFKRLNGISGFDIGITDYEIRNQIKEKESVICSYFTDDFKTNLNTPVGPDAKILIKPFESKILIDLLLPPYHSFDFSTSTFTYLQWKWVVVDTLLSVIKSNYGDRPYKEASEVISKIMNPDSPKSKNVFTLERELIITVARSRVPDPDALQVLHTYGDAVKSKPEDSNDRPLIEIRESNISKKKLYELLNKALETPSSIPFARKDIKVNGPFPLSACKKDDPKYISIRLANGSLTYLGLSIKGTKKNPRYIFTL